MAAERGRPTKEELVVRADAQAEAERRAAQRAGSFAAALYDFLKANGAPLEPLKEGEDPPDASAAALYLKPYLETLTNLERGLPPLPSMPDSGPWALIENDALDVVANEPFKQVAARYGVNEKSMYQWSKRRRWKQRRALLLELQARQSTAAALIKHAQAVPTTASNGTVKKDAADEAEELQDLVRQCIAVFQKGLENGQVQFKSAKDMEILLKTLGWLQGRADKIIEHKHTITIPILEEKLTKIVKRMRFTPEMAGVVTDVPFTVVDPTPGT